MNAILDHTTDSHLVYADWLEERGLNADSWRMPVAVQLPIVKFKNGYGHGYGFGVGDGYGDGYGDGDGSGHGDGDG